MGSMRDDEEYGKQRFHDYLRKKLPSIPIAWKDGNQNVPPDYYLTVATEQFVVEVTALTEYVNTPRARVPRQTIDRSSETLAETIEEESRAAGILNGTYYLLFPIVQRDFYAVREKIKLEVLALIRRTKDDLMVEKFAIEISGQPYCWVYKSPKPGASVKVGVYPITKNWEQEGRNEACDLLENAIKVKAKKLNHLPEPKILILLAEYPFVGPGDYQRCTTQIAQLKSFHTIFMTGWVDREQDYILHTINPDWQ